MADSPTTMTSHARPAVSIDPETGRKIFNTRAAKASEKIDGVGYSVNADEHLKELPPPPPGAVFNAEEQAKYRDFKEARRGAADYMAMEGEFKRYLDDVYSEPPIEREALDDECEVLCIGAGFAGLLLWHKLSSAGFTDVRFCEKGGDVGGTWYWNRYPGIACDVESYSYLPLLEEMKYIPTMKFASGFEILEYCQAMADRFGFYDHCLFHTTVDSTVWDEETGRWTVYTDRGDAMKARYVILANGILTSPKLARIDGMASFAGESFHTSRWDYNIDLEGKRVGIIGTGATAVQVIPEIAKVVGELYVFQRTPSSIDVRDQRETDPEEIAEWSKEPGWARARRKRFSRISSGRTAIKANDDYLAGRVDDFKERKQHARKLSPDELVQKQLNTNFRIMEQIRARVDAIVDDPATAEALKPYYPYGCKRPTFHDEEGTRTFLGLHSHGFPNLFIVSGPQGGGGSFNFTDAIDTHGDYIIWMLTEMRDKAWNVVDITEDSEVNYAEHCRVADITTAPLRDCLSYYNGHGDAQPGSLAYYGGGYWHKWRIAAQESLDPYLFEFKPDELPQPAG
ncbi:NAD(P)/FAD-dependent oxidoreductase [Candidatus Poriferisodalis multihospitum]|uniref:flavin-containing monooxygenase n=1 Tax=Candidatus Poriferisodalis multihospitum TaxID=2983191 RepID=UPI002B25BF73|nr:NAD(P)/FAD-dependent oxidoreductase [Candidatus Poriferisodalis multihospitum]